LITKDMLLFKVIKKYPKTLVILAKYNLGCIGCWAAKSETLEQGLKAHGLNVNKIVKELNNLIEKK